MSRAQWGMATALAALIIGAIGYSASGHSQSGALWVLGALGWAVGIALVGLIVGALTRFRKPALVFVVVAVFGVLSILGSIGRSEAPPNTSKINDPFDARAAPASAADTQALYLGAVMNAAHACAGDGTPFATCLVNVAPPRCRQQAVAVVSNPDEGRRAWLMCLASCAAEGTMSRKFGECKHE